METILLTGLIIGISSSLHCIGMCGPIAMALPVNRSTNWTILSGILQYNFGRIITYSVLGSLFGSIGFTIETFGFLQVISIISGSIMILFAWRKWISLKFSTNLPTIGINAFIGKGLMKVIKSKSPFKLILLGNLNGLLPCGLVYVALMNALLGGNPIMSATSMAFFGIGTLPAMIAVGFVANRINGSLRSKFNRMVPYILTLVGTLIILRGMNLNIPYVSPKISNISISSQVEKNKAPQVEMSCCHKKNSCPNP